MSCSGSGANADAFGGEYIPFTQLQQACGPIHSCPSSITTEQTILARTIWRNSAQGQNNRVQLSSNTYAARILTSLGKASRMKESTMFFLRPTLLFCASALLLALILDGSLLVVARITGWAGYIARPSGWVLTFTTLWALALILGIFLAKILHVFPFYNPMR
jgi:hypothetical protein